MFSNYFFQSLSASFSFDKTKGFLLAIAISRQTEGILRQIGILARSRTVEAYTRVLADKDSAASFTRQRIRETNIGTEKKGSRRGDF